MESDSASRAEQVIARCRMLARLSEDASGTQRTFLSPPMREVHRELAGWLEPLGVAMMVDAVGNLRGLYPGADSQAPRLLLGSHLDTVPNAGAYDGVLGVVIAVALLESLEGRRLPFGLEVLGFSDEEGVRFGVPFISSRAMVGRIDEELLNRKDERGISVRDAIRNFGLNPGEIAAAALKGDVLGYLEFHIEQGPVLEDLGRPLGVVEAIAGQTRMEFIFTGRANHAGTTPMHLRRDALATAAEWVVAVEREARSIPGLVATVGALEAKPGASNVISGEARATLDVRHASDDVRTRMGENLTRQAEEIAARRGLFVKRNTLMEQRAVAMDGILIGQIEAAIRAVRCEPHRMVSGAGHDAMILAEKVPAGMIFLRTPEGISHDPAESVEAGDVAKALECGLHLLEQLSASAVLKRMSRA